ncbi:MAG: hypothetical protein IPQ18_09640 [Saprospiraceae bacterium]|nr:hypothetical protein [Saprospiraceae bacterium]MBL0295201.1 hypothetical protein [Saprospiraceae bacterium]
MEEQGYIEIKFESLIGNTPIKPNDLDIAEIKEIISDVETFLYPSRGEKAERPHISYNIEEGSVRNLFYLPISGVLLFNGLAGEINNRGNIDFLDSKRALIIDKFQRKANEKNLEISFYSSSDIKPILKINRETKFFKIAATQIETEFILYGKVNEEGGNNPNFHLLTKEYGKLVISATEQQLLEGEKRLFKIYGVKAKGKQNLADGKPFDLKLIDYITYNPNYNEHKLDLLIERASVKWNTIPNVDVWLNEIRG